MTSDMMLNLSERRYRALIRYAKEANLNMLRSEGFSIRETDEFYDLCARRFTNIYTFGQIDQVITTFNPDNQYHFVFVCTHKRAS